MDIIELLVLLFLPTTIFLQKIVCIILFTTVNTSLQTFTPSGTEKRVVAVLTNEVLNVIPPSNDLLLTEGIGVVC